MAAAALLAATAGLDATAPQPAHAFPGATVDLAGQGFGHGRGMGQFGALGYSLKGWTYRQILEHYYGGTRFDEVADPSVTVQLTKFDGIDALVGQELGHLKVNGVAPPAAATHVRAHWKGGNSFDIDIASDCGGGPIGWKNWKTLDGPVVITPDVRNEDRTEMLHTCEVGGIKRWLRGELLALEGDGAPRLVNRLDIDNYLRGVVPRESPAAWGTSTYGGAERPGMHALRAQAVAARSYALAERRFAWAQTCDTQQCQVYGGRAEQTGVAEPKNLEDPATDEAVADTRRQVLVMTATGAVARTEFSSSTGGYSAGGVFPAVPDEGDATEYNPSRSWTAKVPVELIEQARPEIGKLLAVDVTKRNGYGAMGGRITELVLRGTLGRATMTGTDLRLLYPYSSSQRPQGIRSDWFRVLNNPSGGLSGYWVAGPDGGVFAFGDAGFFGSAGGLKLNKPVVDMAGSPTGLGYWMVASDGGIFNYGDAPFKGSTGAMTLNQPVVGMAPTAKGAGYWLVASDGGIFSFGDAGFFGSTGAMKLNKPVVGMAPTPSGLGYWLVASDGGIFAFGDAGFFGSTGAKKLVQPVVGMAPSPSGNGYWLLAADGGIFAFGDAGFSGSLPGAKITAEASCLRPTRTGGGYLIATATGGVVSFGDAPALGSVSDVVPGYKGGVAGFEVKTASDGA